MRNSNKILVGKSEGKRPFQRPKRRGENNTGMDLRENCVDWTYLAQDRDL
jgi:hypothetical protein